MNAGVVELVMTVLAILLLLAGHVIACVALVNRMHSTAVHYRLIKVFELPVGLWLLAAPIIAWFARHLLLPRLISNGGGATDTYFDGSPPLLIARLAALAYACFCVGIAAKGIADWFRRRYGKPSPALRAITCEHVDVAERLGRDLAGNDLGRWCARLPGNQIFEVELARKTLAVPRLPKSLEGLTIAHLSDLHFTGRIAREYFEYQIDRTLDFRADMIVVTGDILDARECLDWLPSTLGRLAAPHGVFFLLGNHDLRPGDPEGLRARLVELGLTDVGNRVERREIRGARVCIVGNEQPWFEPAPEISFSRAPSAEDDDAEFPILLSHAPDQYAWAKRRRFPLVLAGHTHGGQIVFPVLGPIVAPSRYGVKYAGGVFSEDGTVMHVSRGMSGEEPLRWNCPPELPLLTLTTDQDDT